jgi:hypothetical protein
MVWASMLVDERELYAGSSGCHPRLFCTAHFWTRRPDDMCVQNNGGKGRVANVWRKVEDLAEMAGRASRTLIQPNADDDDAARSSLKISPSLS